MLHYKFNRRSLLQATMFSVGLAAPLYYSQYANASDELVDAIVIGSGFGGAVAALRLGEAGIETVVLERGLAWPITSAQDTFATYRKPDGRSAWLSPKTIMFEPVPIDIYTGVLERKDEYGISVLCGAGVGGGSLVYNGVTYQPPHKLFYQSLPRAISYEEMDKIYYPRVRAILQPSVIPEDILASSFYQSPRVFMEQASRAGLPNHLLDIALDWDIVRQEINGTKVASTIIGEIWYGINSGSKKSLDQNYLPRAEATGYVKILPLHIVTLITEAPSNSGYCFRVLSNQINDSGEVIRRKSFACRYLFMAAGSMGTSALLVKSKALGTLPRLNSNIGLFWGDNGDASGNRTGMPPNNPGEGGPAVAVIEHYDNPISPTTLVTTPIWNAPEGTLPSLSMGIPPAVGKFSYEAATDSVRLFWPSEFLEVQKVKQAAEFTYSLLDRANTTSSSQPTTMVTPGLTAHPLGGAVLGKACDFYGRVLGYRGLYVVDGALIAGSAGCTNPSFTIAALAERCMDKFLTEIPERRFQNTPIQVKRNL
ncbi:GMC oxidoreductase [Fischerella sp. JS2]|uniref:GMC oxidoreductase n=1 Tax=Fischerella sp. JS2 TaxID=2597771 RepID=UPI0028ED1560|nr:GMC oxidoreductase [Fischerella sp. JS2]